MPEHKTGHKARLHAAHSHIKQNVWMYSTAALVVIAAVLSAFIWMGNGTSAYGAANIAVDWINDYFAAQGAGTTVELVSANQTENGVYMFTVNMTGSQGSQLATYYVSRDGKIFFPQGIMTNQTFGQSQQQQQEIPKTDAPTVELYVMAFCPYGTQAEDAMKPVVDLLGDKADIQVHFIADVTGTTMDSVQSLHGSTEAIEDVRQLCIMQSYGQTVFWNYVMDLNANCVSLYGNASAYDACWKSAAANAGISASQITSCVNGEGIDLITADADLSASKGIGSSPTLVINGVTYSGARTADAYKEAICSAFTSEPSECSQTLSTTSGTASGSC